MGITAVDINNLKILVEKYKPKSVLELGSQYLYDSVEHCNAATSGNPVFGKAWFESRGINHTSVDLNGEADMRMNIVENDHDEVYDWVTDYGTIEHTNSAYKAFKNCHKWTKVGGLMIHENPKTGNWPLHGYWYFSDQFYHNLAKECNYEIIDLKDIAAMGNTRTGWNTYCVLRKKDDSVFELTEEKFLTGIHDK